ncbi:MAG: hypothetical protein R3D71_06470 [Rickettsiales bacterium]
MAKTLESETPLYDALTDKERRAIDHHIKEDHRIREGYNGMNSIRPADITRPEILNSARQSIAREFNNPDSNSRENIMGRYERYIQELSRKDGPSGSVGTSIPQTGLRHNDGGKQR